MKVIKPFFFWALGGSALAITLVVALYFSPMRAAAYFRADPEMASIRAKLDKYQEWLSHTDLRLATQVGENTDSLRAAQTKAWRDYKGWRTRLGELARAHAEPSASGFWPWMHSLRLWILPFIALFALIPGGIAAWRGFLLFRPGRQKAGKTGSGSAKTGSHAARSQALSSFEEAIQKVAQISKADQAYRRPPDRTSHPRAERPVETPAAPPATPAASPPRPKVLGLQSKDPETEFLPVSSPPPPPQDPLAAELSMEDEDAGEPARHTDGGSGTLGVMPPTTEVEKVERRKDEVLKLARKGMTPSEISRRLRISQDQVEFIIRLRREKG